MDWIELVEVGPRDGLQNIKHFVPTETKIRLIHALADAGFKRMEIGSFVSPKAIPQMRDMDEVVRGLGSLGDTVGMALVPNSKGARRAADSATTRERGSQPAWRGERHRKRSQMPRSLRATASPSATSSDWLTTISGVGMSPPARTPCSSRALKRP